ncbi:hypothetical protein [Paucilactobacillus nenjiangensis]|uniref:hypothetical protein n=1 Tax=Paucilactobacillus nenjiangensis TaxID=1296540 RepID=UPI003BB1995D
MNKVFNIGILLLVTITFLMNLFGDYHWMYMVSTGLFTIWSVYEYKQFHSKFMLVVVILSVIYLIFLIISKIVGWM